MPYKLKKKRNEPLYWVITIETGKKHSKDPIPMDKAKAQMRILKSALKKGGADQDFDPEMAGLMGEPVQFAPAQANPFAGLFEPRPRRVRRPKPKRAISTVQGAIVTGDEKRKKTQGEYRGQGSGKWTKFIRFLGKTYNIQEPEIDAAIKANDRLYGPYRFNAKRDNIIRFLGKHLNPTVLASLKEITTDEELADLQRETEAASRQSLTIRNTAPPEISRLNPIRNIPRLPPLVDPDLTNATIVPYPPAPVRRAPVGTPTSFFDWEARAKAKQGEGKRRCIKCGLLR